MKDPLAGRISERTEADIVTDMVISHVFEQFPADGEARLRIYSVISDSLAGVVSSLSGPHTQLLPIIEVGEEAD